MMLVQAKNQTSVIRGNKLDQNIRMALCIVKEVRELTRDTFVLITSRNGMEFTPGQRVKINLMNDDIKRPYSIYGGTDDETLQFLIREVPTGNLSPRLKPLLPGDPIEIIGPNGHFQLNQKEGENLRYLFIATGTGIAPFHSMVKSFKNLNYTLLHGVQSVNEAYDKEHYHPERLIVCTSRDTSGHFHGRVTSYLESGHLSFYDHVYLCGNNDMIKESIEMLRKQGYSNGQIHTEVYY